MPALEEIEPTPRGFFLLCERVGRFGPNIAKALLGSLFMHAEEHPEMVTTEGLTVFLRSFARRDLAEIGVEMIETLEHLLEKNPRTYETLALLLPVRLESVVEGDGIGKDNRQAREAATAFMGRLKARTSGQAAADAAARAASSEAAVDPQTQTILRECRIALKSQTGASKEAHIPSVLQGIETIIQRAGAWRKWMQTEGSKPDNAPHAAEIRRLVKQALESMGRRLIGKISASPVSRALLGEHRPSYIAAYAALLPVVTEGVALEDAINNTHLLPQIVGALIEDKAPKATAEEKAQIEGMVMRLGAMPQGTRARAFLDSPGLNALLNEVSAAPEQKPRPAVARREEKDDAEPEPESRESFAAGVVPSRQNVSETCARLVRKFFAQGAQVAAVEEDVVALYAAVSQNGRMETNDVSVMLRVAAAQNEHSPREVDPLIRRLGELARQQGRAAGK